MEEQMEKVEKHLDRKQEGFYLLLLHQRTDIIEKGLTLSADQDYTFFSIKIHFIQVFIRISS